MNYFSIELNLPIFLLSRNRMKYQHPDVVPKYIAKKSKQYTPLCQTGKENEKKPTATYRKNKHIVGLDELPKTDCPSARPLKFSRESFSTKPWQLPPNRYDVPTKPYESLKGAKGAFWSKSGAAKPNPATVKAPKAPFRFYDTPREMERFNKSCLKHKGVLLSNARERKATARCMVSSPIGCYRNPKFPAPTTHCSELHTIAYNVSPKIKQTPPNPHIFLPQTCVPAKENALHPRNISFKPGPGRYETRFVHACNCSSKQIYAPDVLMAIEREKRLKFRRLPYTKIKSRLYCSPEWRHVTGRGHQHLFKNATKIDEKQKVRKQEVKKTEKPISLYHDSKYIQMINNPERQPISVRKEVLEERPVRVVFNCTAKRTVRRQLRNNKKIAFLSGQERFKDAERPVTLTAKQLQHKIETIPLERRLRNHPIMRKPISQIKSKLQETPLHMLPSYSLRLRKRLFKFLPLPGPKLLVRQETTDVEKVSRFYGAEFSPEQFLKAKK